MRSNSVLGIPDLIFWASSGRCAGFRPASFEPSLKHADGPKLHSPVRPALKMVFPVPRDHVDVKPALAGEAFALEKRRRPVTQGSSEPKSDWDFEAHFWPVDERRGNVTVEYLPEHPFRYVVTVLEIGRQGPGEFHHPVVEERGAAFKGDRHRRPVDLGE